MSELYGYAAAFLYSGMCFFVLASFALLILFFVQVGKFANWLNPLWDQLFGYLAHFILQLWARRRARAVFKRPADGAGEGNPRT
jgi:hypothetical protein